MAAGLFALLAPAFFLISCAKNNELEIDNESQCVVDQAFADQELMSILPAIFQHLSKTSGAGALRGYSTACEPFIYVEGDTVQYNQPAVFRLEASKMTCGLGDGKTRSGALVVRLNGRFSAEGTVCQVQFENYAAGGITFNAAEFKISTGGTTNSYKAFSVEVLEGRCVQNNSTFTFNCKRTVALYPEPGASAEGPYATFYGDASGINRVGLPYTAQVATDIRKNNKCAFFSAGSLSLTPKDFKTRVVTYGNGECDDQASFAVNQNTVAFKLK